VNYKYGKPDSLDFFMLADFPWKLYIKREGDKFCYFAILYFLVIYGIITPVYKFFDFIIMLNLTFVDFA